MGRVIFLLEERSMREFLEQLLPRLFPGCRTKEHFLCVAFEGRHDLESSIVHTLRSWAEPDVRFIVVRDNDGADCRAVKADLRSLCERGGRSNTLVRIVCQELEAWYLGSVDALAQVYEDCNLDSLGRRRRYRDPDAVPKPSVVVRRHCPSFQKIAGARLMGAALDPSDNRSHSLSVFVEGVTRVFTAHFPNLQ